MLTEPVKMNGVRRVDEMRRFRMLMAGVYCGIAISSTYGFSLFTTRLREYGFDQRAITTISTVGNCCGFFTLPMGFVLDHFGPQAVFPLAGFLGFFGFFMFGLTFLGKITPSVLSLSIFNGILYFGCPALDATVMMTLMLNFPRDIGAIVIIPKTFSGLGTSVLMAYYQGWFRGDFSGYAFFVGTQILVCAMVGLAFIRYPPYYMSLYEKRRHTPERLEALKGTIQLYLKQRVPSRRLIIGYVLVGCSLVFLATQSIVMAYRGGDNPRPAFVGLSVVTVVLVTLFALMALPLQFLGRYIPVTPTDIAGVGIATEPAEPLEELPASANEEGNAQEKDVHDSEPLSAHSTAQEADEANEETAVPSMTAPVQVAPQYEQCFFRNLLTPQLWCMWVTCFGMWGTVVVMQMNATQIYKSINYGEYDPPTLTLYITMMSVGNAIGRIMVGIYDMVLSKWQREGRTQVLATVLLPLPPFLCCLAYMFFAVVPARALILPFTLCSIGNGSAWGIGLVGMRKMYARDLGRHYNFCFSAGIIATIVLNRFTFGQMYDTEANTQGTYPECNTPACVRTSMWILMAINGAAVFTALFVHLRFRSHTARELRRREEQGNEDGRHGLDNTTGDKAAGEHDGAEQPVQGSEPVLTTTK